MVCRGEGLIVGVHDIMSLNGTREDIQNYGLNNSILKWVGPKIIHKN